MNKIVQKHAAHVRQILLVGLLLGWVAQAPAALFLSFDGVTGDSTFDGQEGAIVLESIDWGVSVTALDASGKTGGFSEPKFDDLMWTQVQDSSFPTLFSRIAEGKLIKTANVAFVTTVTKQPEVYFEMKFQGVTLTQLNLSASSDDAPSVEGSFAYQQVELIYTPFDETGKMKTPVSAEFDLATNTGNTAALVDLFGRGLSGPEFAPVPVPAAVWMLVSGLLALTGYRRQLHRS